MNIELEKESIKEKYKKQREDNKDKKLVLLGTAVSCFETNFELENTEYWAVGSSFGEAHSKIKKIDLGFEIHPMDQIVLIAREKNVNYNRYKCPIFVQNAEHPISKQLIEKPLTFPIDDLLQYIKEMNASKYLTSSFCYMILYASMMGYKNIALHKILLTSDQEYFLERPGLEYWIDMLGQKEGIDFNFPEDAEMWSSSVLYGYEERPNLWKIESRKKYLWDVFMKHFVDCETLSGLMNRAGGILEMFHVMEKIDDKEKIKKIVDECRATIEEKSAKLKKSRDKFFQFSGALQTFSFMELRQY